nr:MAG TPA: hypothetical protein [Caudoviricetes sp.]
MPASPPGNSTSPPASSGRSSPPSASPHCAPSAGPVSTAPIQASTAADSPGSSGTNTSAGGSVYLHALTAPPNTDRDLVPRRTRRLIPSHAPRWGYDTKPEISR